MPITDALSYQWFDTPNIHAFTIRDFVDLVEALRRDHRAQPGARRRRPADLALKVPWWVWNLFGAQAVFLLTRRT